MAFLLLPADFQIIKNLRFSFFKKNIKLVELADILINDLKIKRNDVLMVHADLNIFKLEDSQPEDLIYLLKMLVGRGGTILMPANTHQEDKISDLSALHRIKLNSRESIVESFSQMPDTLRYHLREEQFVVWGKMVDYLAGINSGKTEEPVNTGIYNKLSFIKGKIIGIGVSISAASGLPVHSVKEDSLEFTKKGISFFRVNTWNI